MTSTAEPDLPLHYPFPLGDTGALPPLTAWAQQAKPVCPVRLPSGVTAWMLTRKDDVAQALADNRFSRNLAEPGSPRMVGEDLTSVDHAIFNLDPPEHGRVRQVLSSWFTRRAVQRHRPLVARHAQRLLAAMADGPNPVDLVEAYTATLPLDAMGEVMGVPPDLAQECRRVYPMSLDLSSTPDAVEKETDAAKQFIAKLIKVRRAEPMPDSPVHALIEAREQGLITEAEMFGTVFLIFVTSFDPLVAPLTTGPMMLMLHRAQLAECQADPALWPKAVEEILRYFHNGGLGFPRVAREDVELRGTLIRAGDALVVPMQAVTWDPRHYRNPERFNIHRATDGSATFGAGPHYCLGSQLARVVLQEAISALFTRFPTLDLAVSERELPWDPNRMFTRPMQLPVTW
ncbi:cytochrome P450 [Kutzneria sp. CA-103260]|uniref:cytochrome P450 n=1 Tax=Kutzneria sp. CA-103260 TaxID=2802641 RepID=UPI001BA517CC|nr:cytochrome P450 [Kutzneria sp. CA-103260]QUQ65927.1 cytochrome P450 [Kutzneria sp. CA-103260]